MNKKKTMNLPLLGVILTFTLSLPAMNNIPEENNLFFNDEIEQHVDYFGQEKFTPLTPLLATDLSPTVWLQWHHRALLNELHGTTPLIHAIHPNQQNPESISEVTSESSNTPATRNPLSRMFNKMLEWAVRNAYSPCLFFSRL